MTLPKDTLPDPDALPNPRWDNTQPPLPSVTELLEQAAESIAPPAVQAEKLWKEMVGAQAYFLLQEFNHRHEMYAKIREYLTIKGETDLSAVRVASIYDNLRRHAAAAPTGV